MGRAVYASVALSSWLISLLNNTLSGSAASGTRKTNHLSYDHHISMLKYHRAPRHRFFVSKNRSGQNYR